jgi:hypothetical protein
MFTSDDKGRLKGRLKFKCRERLVIYLDKSERDQLEALAKRSKVSESQLGRDALIKTYRIKESTFET